ncbi:MAG TPA: hypothetical protein VM939_14980 [Gemmatimonadaceae bacterium]|nr:hypothetical protein [Gemmatimonadaceae bacterium]
MARDKKSVGGPHADGEEKAGRQPTSSSREESMGQSGEDAFERGATRDGARTPDPSDQGDGTTEDTDADAPEGEDPDTTYVGQPGWQNPSSSGTTPLGGENRDSFSSKEEEPGGTE